MIDFFKDNPFIAFIIVFIISLLFLIIIPLLISFISKKVLNKKSNNDYEKNKTTIEAKIYELIFSKGQMTKEEVFSYLNISIDDFDKYLNDMIEKNVIELNKDNKYEIKKHE